MQAALVRLSWLVVGVSLAIGCHDASIRPPDVRPAPAGQLIEGGPVADFAPMQAILTHESVVDLAPEFPGKLTAVLGERHIMTTHHWLTDRNLDDDSEEDPTDDSAVWMRDYQPIFVRERSGELAAVRYLSENKNRTRWQLPWSSFQQRAMPVLHENGNLVSNGRWVFATDALIEENGHDLDDLPELTLLGFRPRSQRALLRLVSQALNKPRHDIIILPRMPHEATGHIDIFVLPLDSNTVMIPSLDEEALALVDSRAREVGRDVLLFLNDQAAELEAFGLTVVRLPMIAPSLGYDDEEAEEAEDFDLVVYTPANMLLAQTPEGKFAFVPSFAKVSDDPKVGALVRRYTATWLKSMAARGWQTHLVDTAELVTHLGLLRCVTASIPQ